MKDAGGIDEIFKKCSIIKRTEEMGSARLVEI